MMKLKKKQKKSNGLTSQIHDSGHETETTS